MKKNYNVNFNNPIIPQEQVENRESHNALNIGERHSEERKLSERSIRFMLSESKRLEDRDIVKDGTEHDDDT